MPDHSHSPRPRFPLGATLLLAVSGLLVAEPSLAYVGPGVGLGMVGSLLGLLAAIVLGLIGLVWLPFKRWRRKRSERKL